MINLRKIYKCKIGVLGIGKTATAVTKLLVKTYNTIFIYGIEKRKMMVNKNMQNKGMEIKKLSFVIVSPSYFKKKKLLRIHKKSKILFYSDIELLYFTAPKAGYINVTGTNGKSTTIKLLKYILKKNNIVCSTGGNIGNSINNLNHYYNFNHYYIVELSSYQINIIKYNKNSIAVLLDITPDHLDQYISIQEYVNDKLKIIRKKNLQNLILNNKNINNSIAHKGNINNSIQLIDKKKRKSYVRIKSIKILNIFDITFKKKYSVHINNLDQIFLVYIVANNFILKKKNIIKEIINFKDLKHREEKIFKNRRLLCINDSKATNIKAAIHIIKKFNSISWILGGMLKENNISEIKGKVKEIANCYFIGKDYKKFTYVLMKNNINLHFAHELINIKKSIKEVKKGTIIFSPACASTDQWQNFKERGKKFKDIILKN